jgi:hypothetical protein
VNPEFLPHPIVRQEDVRRSKKSGWPVPSYTADPVARFFFGRSPSWLRMQMRQVPSDPELVSVHSHEIRIRRKPAGHRVFSLADIEPLAVAITETARQRARTLLDAKSQELAALRDSGEITPRVYSQRRDTYLIRISEVERRLLLTRQIIFAEACLWHIPARWPGDDSDD